MYTSPPTVVVRRAGDARRRLALAAAALMAVVACAAGVASYSTQATAAGPSVESMYHMWLGPNGLPLSPRKQRGLLFQFCTTNFVTEAEMRYCYARLLSVGNPSGPVKFSGQPQYDSEQVVSPLFTFSAPPMAPADAPAAAQVAGTTQLVASGKARQSPTAALYQTQQASSVGMGMMQQTASSTSTRAGKAHVSYAAGYAAGLVFAHSAEVSDDTLKEVNEAVKMQRHEGYKNAHTIRAKPHMSKAAEVITLARATAPKMQ